MTRKNKSGAAPPRDPLASVMAAAEQQKSTLLPDEAQLVGTVLAKWMAHPAAAAELQRCGYRVHAYAQRYLATLANATDGVAQFSDDAQAASVLLGDLRGKSERAIRELRDFAQQAAELSEEPERTSIITAFKLPSGRLPFKAVPRALAIDKQLRAGKKYLGKITAVGYDPQGLSDLGTISRQLRDGGKKMLEVRGSTVSQRAQRNRAVAGLDKCILLFEGAVKNGFKSDAGMKEAILADLRAARESARRRRAHGDKSAKQDNSKDTKKSGKKSEKAPGDNKTPPPPPAGK